MFSEYVIKSKFESKRENSFLRNIAFDLTLDNYRLLCSAEKCAYTDEFFDSVYEESQFTVERVDNNYGYVPGNVVPVIYIANRNKADMDVTQIKNKINSIEYFTNELIKMIDNTNKKIESKQNAFNNSLNPDPRTLVKIKNCQKNVREMNSRLTEDYRKIDVLSKIVVSIESGIIFEKALKYITPNQEGIFHV